MKPIDEVSMVRYKINSILGNTYIMVGGEDLMVTIADENKREQEQLRATTEAICRISSKALKLGMDMLDIADQLRRADSGRNTILTEIAAKLELYKQGENQ